MYKVTEKDLIGDLEGFPIEVVQKMLKKQVEQGNMEDVTVFQNYYRQDKKTVDLTGENQAKDLISGLVYYEIKTLIFSSKNIQDPVLKMI